MSLGGSKVSVSIVKDSSLSGSHLLDSAIILVTSLSIFLGVHYDTIRECVNIVPNSNCVVSFPRHRTRLQHSSWRVRGIRRCARCHLSCWRASIFTPSIAPPGGRPSSLASLTNLVTPPSNSSASNLGLQSRQLHRNGAATFLEPSRLLSLVCLGCFTTLLGVSHCPRLTRLRQLSHDLPPLHHQPTNPRPQHPAPPLLLCLPHSAHSVVNVLPIQVS